MLWHLASAFGRRHCSEQGQVALFAPVLMIVLIGGFAAVAVDMGSYVRGRQQVENAVDAAALAGAQMLPGDGTTADALARWYATTNGHDPNDPSMTLDISFRCIVRDHNGEPDPKDIDAICPQIPKPPPPDTFGCKNGFCFICCKFNAADNPGKPCNTSNKCNTIVVEGSKDVPFSLAPVLGVPGLSTGIIRGSACCGLLDVVIIIDRTFSMTPSGLRKAQDAAKAALQVFNPPSQHVALAVLPQSRNDNKYESVLNSDMPYLDRGRWLLVNLNGDYKNGDGTLKEDSDLVYTIENLKLAPDDTSPATPPTPRNPFPPPNPPYPQTNLAEPIRKAHQELDSVQGHGRPGAKKGIILLTDGAADLPSPPEVPAGKPCGDAVTQATVAKGTGVEIFTIGFALSEGGTIRKCPANEPLPYKNMFATPFLAAMATESQDETGCDNATEAATENADGDHFLCQPRTAELIPVFEQAAEALLAAGLAAGFRLVHVPGDL